MTNCIHCGAFHGGGWRGKKRYCSRRCEWEALKGPAFNAAIARMSAKHRGDMQRDRGNADTYRKRDGRHEHRFVAENMIGRKLLPGEIVHHRDHNKRNNDPANLAVMTRAQHMREHGMGIPGQPPPWVRRQL